MALKLSEDIVLFTIVLWNVKLQNILTFSETIFSMKEVPEIVDLEIKKRLKAEKKIMSLLDMPNPVLDRVIHLLPPATLCRLAAVCRELRERCSGDCLWEKLLKQKWGKLIGHFAYVHWQCFVIRINKLAFLEVMRRVEKSSSPSAASSSSEYVSGKRQTFSLIRSVTPRSCVPNDSIRSFYFAIENGKFWFPAQVFSNKMCYDVEARYDSGSNTFRSRESPYGSGRAEVNIEWERTRAPPLHTPPNEVHISECLDDLKPGDYIEIQWRHSQTSHYDWWFAVLGHLDSCDRKIYSCQCHNSEVIMVELQQYGPGCPWRRNPINKRTGEQLRNHMYLNGTYGGIRKLYEREEIIRWKRMF